MRKKLVDQVKLFNERDTCMAKLAAFRKDFAVVLEVKRVFAPHLVPLLLRRQHQADLYQLQYQRQIFLQSQIHRDVCRVYLWAFVDLFPSYRFLDTSRACTLSIPSRDFMRSALILCDPPSQIFIPSFAIHGIV